jgi:protein-S-isoprenylcysteine O-methyltransferase Ste14
VLVAELGTDRVGVGEAAERGPNPSPPASSLIGEIFMSESTAALAKTAIFIALVPCSVVAWIPLVMIDENEAMLPASLGVREVAALALAGAGVTVAFRSMLDFARIGFGTPAPIDPPKRLVVAGWYHYTRNPMYVGIAGVLLAEAIFFRSWALAVYAAAIVTMFHLFVVLYEEPTLARTFGADYAAYRAAVSRWLGRPRAFRAPDA